MVLAHNADSKTEFQNYSRMDIGNGIRRGLRKRCIENVVGRGFKEHGDKRI